MAKDKERIESVEENDEYKEIYKIRVHPIKMIKLDNAGNEDGFTFGFEFFNQYNSEYDLGMESWEELMNIKNNGLKEEINTYIKNQEIKKMIKKYGGVCFNDEWIELKLD